MLARAMVAVILILGSQVLAPGAVQAQTASGTISGTVKDETGGALPGASVVVRNTETSLERRLATDEGGRYSAPNLPPGPYEVTASMDGFATTVRSGIRLTVGRDAVVDFAMQLGGLEERLTVAGEAPTIDVRTGSTGGLIEEEQIKNLPLNGRSFIELARLTPGVLPTDTGGRNATSGFGSKLSVHGSRYSANLFTLDGTNVNDQFNQGGSASGNMLGVEAVREFQVLTNSFSAEFGRHTGGVINAATKSGTNALHGSVFEFHRNDALDARNFFDPPDGQPDFTRNQFGGSVGGPIVRDRTFFFATYEGLRERLGQSLIFTVPTDAVRGAGVDARIRPFLDSYPLPNGRLFGTTRGEFLRQTSRDTDEHYVVGRVDHQFSPGSQVFGRYTFNDGEVDDPRQLMAGTITRTRFHFATVEHTAIRGASLLNRVQFGLTRSRMDSFDYVLADVSMPRTTFTDITRGLLTMSVTGLSGYGGVSTNPKFHTFNNYQFRDTLTYSRARHSVKIGGSLEILQYDLTSDFTSMGSFSFQSLDEFLAVSPRTFDAVLPGSDTLRRLRQVVFGFFVQDDIQVTDRFTLNAGLRYEPVGGVTEADGKLAQLIDFADPAADLTSTTVVEELFVDPSKGALAPRLGFAWDPTGSGKTAVRGGFGVFQELTTISTPFVQNVAVRVPPFFNRGGLVRSTTFAIDFPEAYFTQTNRLAAQTQLEGVQYEPDQPRMMKWNVNVQRELAPRTTVEAGYTGTRGADLFRMVQTNGRVAIETADGRLFVPASEPLRQPNFGRMRLRASDSASEYHGLTLGLTRRFGSGLQAQASYTFSRSIDDGASPLGGNEFDNDNESSRYLFSIDRGLSPFDVRHAFTANVNYELPFARDRTGAAGRLLGGWAIGTLLRLRSGYPFSASSGVDTGRQVWAATYPDLKSGASGNPVLGGPDRYFDPAAFELPPDGVIGNLGRNTLIGPGQSTVDVMAAKVTPLAGDTQLQVRLELFNLFNRANFSVPSGRAVFNTNGTIREDAGRITSTSTSARQIQLGVKVIW
jgi:hypothetical protein